MTQVRNNFYLLVYDISLFDYALEFQKLGTISNGRVQRKVFSKVLLVHMHILSVTLRLLEKYRGLLWQLSEWYV